MASFARSLKPHAAYLSPRRRPAMPGRTLSNSSELSVASNASAAHADDVPDLPVSSAPGTPAAVAAARTVEEDNRPATMKGISENQYFTSPQSADSRPIAIELPKIKKLAAAPVYTPPEPLSARGDLPGGYFPMHEDPKGRVHRPHPFHHDASSSRRFLHHSDSAAMHAERKDIATMAQASMPVSSYLAPGFHDSPLPMGKYYPSNYEQHQRNKGKTHTRLTVADSLAASVKPDVPSPKQASHLSTGETPEAESRRKMQQYQRDMIAQAAMALGGSAKVVSKSTLSGLPLKEVWLSAPSAHKPLSPRLHPLGSPGPVTPMDLESVAGGYLDHGNMAQDLLSKETAAANSAGHATQSI